MKKRTNHLASRSELIKANNRLPKTIYSYFEQQAQLTVVFRQAVASLLSEQMAELCQVVRYFNEELIVSVSSPTLVNHLQYLLPTLKNTLKTHENLVCLDKIHLVYCCDLSVATKP